MSATPTLTQAAIAHLIEALDHAPSREDLGKIVHTTLTGEAIDYPWRTMTPRGREACCDLGEALYDARGAARADESARARWHAVYGAAVARFVGGVLVNIRRAPTADEWPRIVDAARTEADAAAEAWAMLDATGAGK